MEDKKYLIICLRDGYWSRYENIVFWGKNKRGYYSDLSKVGLYTKEEALKICNTGNCFIHIDKLGITKEMMSSLNPNIEIKVKKTDSICRYINAFVRIMDNKRIMKWGA